MGALSVSKLNTCEMLNTVPALGEGPKTLLYYCSPGRMKVPHVGSCVVFLYATGEIMVDGDCHGDHDVGNKYSSISCYDS